MVNDLSAQHLLLDRRHVYNTLLAHGLPVPRHVLVARDSTGTTASTASAPGRPPPPEAWAPTARCDEEVEETEEFLRVGSTKIGKPFVEKPVDAEDHNMCGG